METQTESRPWETEPNAQEWTAHGLLCRLRRGPMGAWCGYVGIPYDHPCFGLGYSEGSDKLAAALEERKKRPIGETAGMGVMLAVIFGGEIKPSPEIVFEVHGGITWAKDHSPPDPKDELWWFGFDCSHAGDLSPESLKYSRPITGDVYRDMAYAGAETERLAEQLAALLPLRSDQACEEGT